MRVQRIFSNKDVKLFTCWRSGNIRACNKNTNYLSHAKKEKGKKWWHFVYEKQNIQLRVRIYTKFSLGNKTVVIVAFTFVIVVVEKKWKFYICRQLSELTRFQERICKNTRFFNHVTNMHNSVVSTILQKLNFHTNELSWN